MAFDIVETEHDFAIVAKPKPDEIGTADSNRVVVSFCERVDGRNAYTERSFQVWHPANGEARLAGKPVYRTQLVVAGQEMDPIMCDYIDHVLHHLDHDFLLTHGITGMYDGQFTYNQLADELRRLRGEAAFATAPRFTISKGDRLELRLRKLHPVGADRPNVRLLPWVIPFPTVVSVRKAA